MSHMPRPKVSDMDFIDFLIATPRQATATEAERTQPTGVANPAAHDAYTRLLHRPEPDSEALWAEVRPDVRPRSGVLARIDQPCACASGPRAVRLLLRRVVDPSTGGR